MLLSRIKCLLNRKEKISQNSTIFEILVAKSITPSGRWQGKPVREVVNYRYVDKGFNLICIHGSCQIKEEIIKLILGAPLYHEMSLSTNAICRGQWQRAFTKTHFYSYTKIALNTFEIRNLLHFTLSFLPMVAPQD